MEVLKANRALLNRLLPDADLGDVTVHEGQFHQVVIGADRVVCLARTDAAAARLPQRAATLRVLAGLDLGFRIPEPLQERSRQKTGKGLPRHEAGDTAEPRHEHPPLAPSTPSAPLSASARDDGGAEPADGVTAEHDVSRADEVRREYGDGCADRAMCACACGDDWVDGIRCACGDGWVGEIRCACGDGCVDEVTCACGDGRVDDVRFLVLSRVPGAPLEVGMVADPEVAEVVASQYVALLTGLGEAASRAGEEARAVLTTAEGRWRQFAADVRTELYRLMPEDGRLLAERQLAALDDLPDLAVAVVHGDLGAENVLWERDDDGLPRLSGVVDWDEVSIGDPAEDLAALGASYGDGFLERVLRLGGWRDDDDLRRRITTIRGTFALQQALSALRDGDQVELADGLTGYVAIRGDVG
ncbi:hypothetical protein GCM10022224_066220 [Nonomuraea antimicrobica]|uniref:Aminoglycoside phosphotransferase domain-containing protein n=1 Tax=Nonomuraea antimicrobica TaxID=561173 RepID=A0ABP7CMH3_9ACTN